MTDRSAIFQITGLPTGYKTGLLSAEQRRLLELMREHRFGRIEHLLIQNGQPVLTKDVKVVRVARLGNDRGAATIAANDDFELKQSVRDLFDELARLQNGVVVRFEFRHGLPFSLETIVPT